MSSFSFLCLILYGLLPTKGYVFCVFFPTFTTFCSCMRDCPIKMKIHGKATVGSKSQIVIPKDVRELLNIKPGDDLMIISKGDMAIGMIKSDDVEKFLQYVKAELQY